MEETVAEITTSGIFEETGTVITEFLGLTGDFFAGLWSNPMGRIVCVLGLASGVIALAYRLFLRRKHV